MSYDNNRSFDENYPRLTKLLASAGFAVLAVLIVIAL